MKKKLPFLILFFLSVRMPAQTDIRLLTQFINPCGNDGSNEFVIALTTNIVNVGNLGFASINHTSVNVQPDFNWYWFGKNVINAPRPTFTSNAENCGVAGSGLSCFRLLDPGTAGDATVIDNVRNTLNTIAGCNVFLPVPASGDIPANSLVAVFLGAGGCGLDVPATNLNFSNHCSGGTPLQQYFLVVGNGAYTPLSGCNGGYFVNAVGTSRTSTIYNYTGGGNTIAANYQTNSVVYTNGGSPSGGNAAVIVPDGSGGSFWNNTSGCVPTYTVILEEKDFNLEAVKCGIGLVKLNWNLIASTGYDYLVLEKSTNGVQFEEISRQTTGRQTGPVFSGSTQDASADAPLLYYRMKAVALNGKTAFSNTRLINNLGIKKITLYPNPAQKQVTFRSSFTEDIRVSVVDLNGAEVYRSVLHEGLQPVNTSAWPAGLYSVRLSQLSGQLIETQKFLKL